MKSKPTKMVILYCYDELAGGESHYSSQLLTYWQKKKSDLTLLPHVHRYFTGANSLQYFFWLFSSLVISFYTVTVKLLSKKPTVVYSVTALPLFVAALLKYFLPSPPTLIFHFHGERIPPKILSLKTRTLFTLHSLNRRIMMYIHEVTLKHCSLVIFRSQLAKTNYLKTFPFLKKIKTVVIPNAYIPIQPKLTKNQAYKKLSLPKNSSLISYIGRLDPIKHIDALLESFFLLRYKRSHLLICFPKPCNVVEKKTAEKLFKLASQKPNTISFYQENKKYVTHQDILSSSDLVVSLSEVESLIMLQTFALGIPYLTNTQEVSGITAISKTLFVSSKKPKEIAKAMDSILKLSLSKQKILKTKMQTYTKQFTLTKVSNHILKSIFTALPQSR